MSAARGRSADLDPVVREDLAAIAACGASWERLRGKTVLVAGAGGMLASYMALTVLHLNDALGLGASAVALVRDRARAERRFGALLDRPDLSLLVQDVRDPIAWDGPADFIVHGASPVNPGQFAQDPAGTLRTGALGTLSLLDLAVAKRAEGFLLLSTREVYGATPDGLRTVGEDDFGPLDPTQVRSCYPEGKRFAEAACAAYRKQHGLDARIARIGHAYGPGIALGDGRVIGDFLSCAARGVDIVLNSDGSGEIGPTYLADVVAGLWKVLLDFRGTAYNLADDRTALTVGELARILCALVPEKGIRPVFRPADPERKAGYLAHRTGLLRAERAAAEGWRATTSLEDGLRRTLDYLGRQGTGGEG